MSNLSIQLENLLEQGGRQLYALLVRLTLRVDAADDLLQELVVRLSQSAGFRCAKDPFFFARKAAINLAFDWRRRRKLLRKMESLTEEPPAEAVSPLNAIIAREDYERILSKMEELSPVGRGCLVMRYLEQLSYPEIARHFGTTPHRVRGACHKAVRRLQQLLEIDANAQSERRE